MPHNATVGKGGSDNTATDAAAEYERRRRADGATCHEAALHYLRRFGWSVLCLCPSDHVGVGRTHGKHCDSWGKSPWGPWKHFQDTLPTAEELTAKWRDLPTA